MGLGCYYYKWYTARIKKHGESILGRALKVVEDERLEVRAVSSLHSRIALWRVGSRAGQ